ncbi:MAG: hypothetical protein IPF73_15615 [Betaproteobacteria bacterium]|nr:hypothetical protein [Betaproteobacteria bacterium]
MRFDRAFRVAAITEPFRFADEPIEFAAGSRTTRFAASCSRATACRMPAR